MIRFDLSFPPGLSHSSTVWLLYGLAILSLASCQPSGPSPTVIHASTCVSENEARLPITAQRLRAEIERIAGLSPGGYTLTSVCQLDTGQFVVKIMLTKGHDVVDPIQIPTFVVQTDGRVERVKEEGGDHLSNPAVRIPDTSSFNNMANTLGFACALKFSFHHIETRSAV